MTVGRTRAKQDRAGEGGREISAIARAWRCRVRRAGHFRRNSELCATSTGYSVGGTIHVIVNNLIGFTTLPSELHSSRFAAQLARRQTIPIFHVNAEDVDAVMRVAALALEYRYTFR